MDAPKRVAGEVARMEFSGGSVRQAAVAEARRGVEYVVAANCSSPNRGDRFAFSVLVGGREMLSMDLDCTGESQSGLGPLNYQAVTVVQPKGLPNSELATGYVVVVPGSVG